MRAHEQLELLSAYVDGALDDATVRSVEAHLPGCSECRTTLDALRATMADLALLTEPELDPSMSWSLRAQIARARNRPGRFTRAAMALSGVAAVAVAFVAFSVVGGDDRASTDTGAGTVALSEAATDTSAPPVFVDSGTYDADSAQTLLDPTMLAFGGDAQDAAGLPAPAQERITTQGKGDSSIDWSDVFTRCEPTVTKDPDTSYSVRAAIGSRFDDEPALLLVYEIAQGDTLRRELWVLHAESCDVLFFAQD